MKNEVKLYETTPTSLSGVLCVCIPLHLEVGAKVKDLMKDFFFKLGPLIDQLFKSVEKVLREENWSDHCK